MKPNRMTILLVMMTLFLFGFAFKAMAQDSGSSVLAAENSGSAAAAALIIAQFLSSVKVGGFIAWAISEMEKSKSPYFVWVNTKNRALIHLLSLLGAAMTASGIDYAWNGMNHSLVITGLTVPAVAHAIWHTAQNYLVQKGWYNTVFTVDGVAVPPPAAKT